MRLSVGILLGFACSFVSVSLFNMWTTFYTAVTLLQQNVFRMLSALVGANFEYNIITLIISGPYTLDQILSPALLACILCGFVSGLSVKGIKRGIMSSFVVVVLMLLMWILFSIFSAFDLMALFQGPELIETVGGIIGATLGSVLGGVIGGAVGGPYEEIF